ncbi:hypothetical protein [Agrobacterium sp. RAC06]|uniref:hypothetical protein n=1 Tax=Agrobacterium sp. RAC06 TaxID=1842536 RepID=UPI00083DD19D|nr:hypothetical protein [Agrobacterium sp. RAC06]AOG11903.1 hypothetical protein BSY240_1951 [Agrobacterium sp. RAC06]
MSLNEMINTIADKGKLRVRISVMKAIAAQAEDLLKRSDQADYNWDVISLYFTPEDGGYEQKTSYDDADAALFLTAWRGMKGTTSSTTISRGLQGLEYIIDMTGDGVVTDVTGLTKDISAEYRHIGSPVDERR